MKASNWISDIAKQAAPLTHFIISWETHKRQGSVMAVVGQQQLGCSTSAIYRFVYLQITLVICNSCTKVTGFVAPQLPENCRW